MGARGLRLGLEGKERGVTTVIFSEWERAGEVI